SAAEWREISVRADCSAQNAAYASKEVYRFHISGPDLERVLFNDMAGIFEAQDRRRMRKQGHSADDTGASPENLIRPRLECLFRNDAGESRFLTGLRRFGMTRDRVLYSDQRPSTRPLLRQFLSE